MSDLISPQEPAVDFRQVSPHPSGALACEEASPLTVRSLEALLQEGQQSPDHVSLPITSGQVSCPYACKCYNFQKLGITCSYTVLLWLLIVFPVPKVSTSRIVMNLCIYDNLSEAPMYVP